MANSKWTRLGSNIMDTRTKEEKEKYRKKMFKWGMAIDRMPYNKAKFTKKKDNREEEIEEFE